MRSNCIAYALRRYAQVGGYFAFRWTDMNRLAWCKWPHMLLLHSLDGIEPCPAPKRGEWWNFRGYLVVWRSSRIRWLWTKSLERVQLEHFQPLNGAPRWLPPLWFEGYVATRDEPDWKN